MLLAILGNPRASFLTWSVVALMVPNVGLWGYLSAAAGWVLYKFIKSNTARPRPFQAHSHIVAYAPPPDAHSFPSGHTLNAVILGMTLVAAYPAIAPLALVWMVSTGISRVVLGLHYPSDIIAGGLLGAMLGAFAVMLAGKIPLGFF